MALSLLDTGLGTSLYDSVLSDGKLAVVVWVVVLYGE